MITDFDYLMSFESLCKHYDVTDVRGDVRTFSGLSILFKISKEIENMSYATLDKLIYYLYHGWPHNRLRSILLAGAKRGIQSKFYIELYGNEPSQRVLQIDHNIREQLELNEDSYEDCYEDNHEDSHVMLRDCDVTSQKTKKEKKMETDQKPQKQKKPMTVFASKIKNMDLESIIKWAIELNIPQEKIDKHIGKANGLAKMNISNLIRGELRRQNKLE